MKLYMSYLLPLFGSKSSYPSFLVPCNSGLVQIESLYSIYDYDKDKDDYRYASKRRKRLKQDIYENNVVEDHHIIPKQYKFHPLIHKLNYDVSCSHNLIIMPTYYGQWVLNKYICSGVLIHNKGHCMYNNYVLSVLNTILNDYESCDDMKYEFWLFLNHLKYCIQNNEDIPWR